MPPQARTAMRAAAAAAALGAGWLLTATAATAAPAAPQATHTASAPATSTSRDGATRAHATAAPAVITWTVRPGDSLSSISKLACGTPADWPSLWFASRHQVHNPDALATGLVLTIECVTPGNDVINAALAAIPPPPPPPAPAPPPPGQAPATQTPAAGAVPAPAPAAGTTTAGAAPGSFQQCVITAESGGNPSAVNASSGAGGLYGFLPSTWQALGHSGLPENAPVAEQNQAFQQEYAQSGTAAWSAYDGC